MAKLHFPDKTLDLMRKSDLSEATVRDVFHNGEYRKSSTGAETVVRKYDSYGVEVGIYFSKSKNNHDEYIITYVWKRDRK